MPQSEKRAHGAKPRIKVGLIGADIQASKSPALHEREAAHHGFDYSYDLIDLAVRTGGAAVLPLILKEVEDRGFAGVNITFPVKQAVIEHLTDLSPEARSLGAVNTVVLRDGKRTGHNTDWYGFHESFRLTFPDVPRGCALLLGAGGAGSAVAHAALALGVRTLLIHDVERERANDLATRLNDEFGADRAVVTTDIPKAMSEADGLIHATPTGMAKHPGLPLDGDLLRSHQWVADIVYMPLVTPLLAHARATGCRVLDGGGMVVYQAVGALQLFAGIEADPARMRSHFAALVA
ncbi:shikimate dehydrogenase [Mesorhizobium microcysteis]|uniref:Shikimate dehydrogenase n=1 Tax=Neoaquamicrobium microcysteis TaxID=2682781 RepID=A0A5D4H1K2_9HYPH|nr:shikimate dehydrogenase [Mesorhizobium microcysteis]TYR32710.1 shikimate dehydrogenase [Mesorhizobium microcysteis]